MKTKHIITVIICLLIGGTADAQIFKEIMKVVGKKEKKTTEKTDEEKAEMNKKAMSIFGGSLEGLPETYQFSYVVDMQITSKKDETTMQYFVEPDATYFGNALPEDKTNSIIVYDMENQAMVTFMDNDGNKMAMKMRIPISDKKMQALLKKESDATKTKIENGTITPLPDKKILGYTCKGYQIIQKDGVSKIWFTNEAPVSFVGMFASADKMPKNLSGDMIPFGPKSMMLEMEYTANKRKRDNMRMVCTGIEEKSFAIALKDYKTGM
ncbi:DUF4412 domain-containing protein [Subsaximicrobium wynnwilliamsii]|nr:DUF4412 domain-containing protein [Subsaximicrobium wynnwilliamsii]